MLSLHHAFKRIGGLLGLLLVATSCIGTGNGEPLLTPASTATNEAVINQADSATATSAIDEAVVEQSEPEPTRIPADKYADFEIVTLLPRDAIPAIDNPRFLSADEADNFYDPDELVMGVTFNGETRAYSVPFLSGHEIVNDTVGGEKIAVTW